jgi:pyridoxine/pyridoxamine 5'-phosphate oxidase
MQHTKQQILDFINAQPRMVLSTVSSKGNLVSAVVGFGQTEKFELVFGTLIQSRKAQNIIETGNVSVVIGFDHNGTVQYEGRARKLEGDEIDKYAEYHFQKHPKSRQYKNEPGETYFLIEPKWLRFTEVAYDPWKTTELSFE